MKDRGLLFTVFLPQREEASKCQSGFDMFFFLSVVNPLFRKTSILAYGNINGNVFQVLANNDTI